VRSFSDRDLGAFWQQHPNWNFQPLPDWVHDTDRAISSLRSSKDLQGNTMERVKGVEDLNVRIVRAQGIVGVGVITRICTAWCPGAGSHRMVRAGPPAAPASSCRSRCCRECSRGLFLHYLEKALAAGELRFFSEHRHLHEPAAFQRYLAPTRETGWVVYVNSMIAQQQPTQNTPCDQPSWNASYRGRTPCQCLIMNPSGVRQRSRQ